jgi:adenylyltransferase/sulfurtransferase
MARRGTTPSAAACLLTEQVLRRIFEHARRDYPLECCGMVLADGAVRECRNAQDEFHAADPEAFPRTAANGYCFDFTDQLFLARSQEGAAPVRIVYHSHPDASPAFSSADKSAAMSGEFPIYPGLAYLIVSCAAGLPGVAVLYEFAGGDWSEAGRYACPSTNL